MHSPECRKSREGSESAPCTCRVTATVGTPTPTPKRPTLYLAMRPDEDFEVGWLCVDVSDIPNDPQLLQEVKDPRSFIATIPGETDAAPQPTGDVLAAADALANTVDGYKGVGPTTWSDVLVSLAAFRAARNATTKKETTEGTSAADL